MNVQQLKTAREFAEELKEDVFGIELHTRTIGRSRTMNVRQKEEVADHFGAKKQAVGSSKKLFAPNQQEIKNIHSLIREAISLWKEMTVWYRRGVRLLRKVQLDNFIERFEAIEADLNEAIQEADDHMDAIIERSKEFLGEKLFDINDYPKSFKGTVSISWSTHNFKPSEELLKLAPETYEREQQRVREQFEQAIRVYEREAYEQLADLVNNLVSKLEDSSNGKKVKFSEATTTNLREFFERFKTVGIYSDEGLTELVEQANETLGGTTMAQLKKDRTKRRNISKQFKEVKEKLDTLLIDAPSRSINLEDLED